MRDVLKLRLREIEQEARSTFGDDFYQKWSDKPSRFFENRSPNEFASDEKRAELVLTHIRYFRGASI